jgi:hypothetical protein
MKLQINTKRTLVSLSTKIEPIMSNYNIAKV